MSDFSILVKNNFRLFINGLKYSKNKGKKTTSTGLFVILGAFILFSMITAAIGMTNEYIAVGVPEGTIYYAMSYSLLLMVMLALLRGVTTAKTTDADLLLSMPLKKTTIILSKSVTKYLFEFLPVLAFYFPYAITYAVLADCTVGAFLRIFLIGILLPFVSVGIAYILNYLMFKLGNLVRKPQAVTTTLSFVVLGVFMVYNFSLSSSMGTASVVDKFGKIAPVAWSSEFIVKGDIIGLLLFLCISVIPFALGIVLFASIFGARKKAWKSKKKDLEFKQCSPLAALYRQEMKRYFGCSIYVMNTLLGPILSVILAGALVLGGEKVDELLSDPALTGYAPMIAMVAFSFMPGLTAISVSSISLEGKNISILRAVPLDEKTIFRSKILVNIVISLPATLVTALVGGAALGFTAVETVAFALVPSCLSVLVSVMGLYINLVFPKFDWENEVVVVKQSTAVGLALMAGMLLSALPVLICLTMSGIGFALQAAICALIYLALAGGFWLLIMSDGKKRFAQMF